MNDTVDVFGEKIDGSRELLGTTLISPKMKARELVQEMFGSIDEDDGDDGAMALWRCGAVVLWCCGAVKT